MRSDLLLLYNVQLVDSELALVARQYQALDQGQAEQAAFEQARSQHEEKLRLLQETTRDLHDSELQLKSVEEKKKDYETRLYGNKIKGSFKELEAAQQEIEALGRQRSWLDEKILNLMEEAEVRRKEEAEAKVARQKAEKAWTEKQAAYKAAARALVERAKRLTADRAERAKLVPEPLMKRYETIRAHKQGVGIARIVDDQCGACRTTLPTNLVRSVRETDRIETCENCGRLLCMEAE
jgi:predicted  nucleic acid-binding Zn-ribbon protein